MKPEAISIRICEVLKLKPMTGREIATSLSASDENVRTSLQRLERRGCVRRAGFKRVKRCGTSAYLWERTA